MTKCTNFIKQTSMNQYCLNCIGLIGAGVGAYCNIIDNPMSNSSTASRLIMGGAYAVLTIPGSSSQISLQYSCDQANV
jgi:hypothetical protein